MLGKISFSVSHHAKSYAYERFFKTSSILTHFHFHFYFLHNSIFLEKKLYSHRTNWSYSNVLHQQRVGREQESNCDEAAVFLVGAEEEEVPKGA